MKNESILNLSYNDLILFCESILERPFRAAQIWEWVYQKGVWRFDQMHNLSKNLRQRLEESFILKPHLLNITIVIALSAQRGFRPRVYGSSALLLLRNSVIHKKQISRDGTTKILFDLEDRQKIETVLIPTATRATVCLSTQAGCKFGCKFCASGIGGWARDLTCAEMITQVLHIKEESLKHKRTLSHIVFMGVGEPLDTVALRC